MTQSYRIAHFYPDLHECLSALLTCLVAKHPRSTAHLHESTTSSSEKPDLDTVVRAQRRGDLLDKRLWIAVLDATEVLDQADGQVVDLC